MEAARETPGPLLLSVSGAGRFTHCEEKFLAVRQLPKNHDEHEKGYGATLGTLLHLLVREVMFGRDWRPLWTTLLAAEPGWSEEWEAPEHFLHAEWLMDRYVEVFGGEFLDDRYEQLTAISAEVTFDLPLPGAEDYRSADGSIHGVRVRGFFDGLDFSARRGLVLDEIKSMGRWDKFYRCKWEPQLPTYFWAAHSLGLPVTGGVFRAIGTGHKRDAKKQAPARDSFRDQWVPFNQAQIDKVLDDYRRIARRAIYVIDHPADAVRNPGEMCKYCPIKRDCLGLDLL